MISHAKISRHRRMSKTLTSPTLVLKHLHVKFKQSFIQGRRRLAATTARDS